MQILQCHLKKLVATFSVWCFDQINCNVLMSSILYISGMHTSFSAEYNSREFRCLLGGTISNVREVCLCYMCGYLCDYFKGTLYV